VDEEFMLKAWRQGLGLALVQNLLVAELTIKSALPVSKVAATFCGGVPIVKLTK
jgi:hypothetical protein